MGEWHKYVTDGTPKKAFTGKSVQRNPHKRNALSKHNTSYAQLSAKIVKLEKSNKKIKHSNKKHKMITTATAMTPIHPEAMGLVALRN